MSMSPILKCEHNPLLGIPVAMLLLDMLTGKIHWFILSSYGDVILTTNRSDSNCKIFMKLREIMII